MNCRLGGKFHLRFPLLDIPWKINTQNHPPSEANPIEKTHLGQALLIPGIHSDFRGPAFQPNGHLSLS